MGEQEVDFVKCIIEMRQNSTSCVKERDIDLELEDGLPDYSEWTEGSFLCDCNRHLAFEVSLGEDCEDENDNTIPFDWDIPCTEGAYAVNFKNKETGEYYYQEFEN